MGSPGMRVMLASDQPEVLRFLERVVEQKLGGVVVGKGENAVRALGLVRRLRPDIAIIDSYLPHQISLRDVPISRNAGLDTAQAISAEIPNVRVMLVDTAKAGAVFPAEFALLRPVLPGAGRSAVRSQPGTGIAFASLQTRPIAKTKTGFSDACITVGSCGLLFGLVLTATMFLAYAGLPLIALGIASLVVGCVGKLVSWPRSPETHSVEGPDLLDFWARTE